MYGNIYVENLNISSTLNFNENTDREFSIFKCNAKFISVNDILCYAILYCKVLTTDFSSVLFTMYYFLVAKKYM